eukprot:356060_1
MIVKIFCLIISILNANTFDSCLNNDHSANAWYDGQSFNSVNNVWNDKTLNNQNGIISGIINYFDGNDNTNSLYLNGQSSVYGGTSTQITFGNDIGDPNLYVRANHSVINLCKYNGNNKRRIIQGLTINSIFGHWGGMSGVDLNSNLVWMLQGSNLISFDKTTEVFVDHGSILSIPFQNYHSLYAQGSVLYQFDLTTTTPQCLMPDINHTLYHALHSDNLYWIILAIYVYFCCSKKTNMKITTFPILIILSSLFLMINGQIMTNFSSCLVNGHFANAWYDGESFDSINNLWNDKTSNNQ